MKQLFGVKRTRYKDTLRLNLACFPLVKNRRTINKQLDGKIITGQEKNYCSILLPDEKDTIVQYVLNKNRCYQGINRAELNELIMSPFVTT